MSIVVRYFSTTGAGAADGTTWADRAALFTTGNWSSVITGFAFNGSDSLEARIGPGTYTCSQSLASALFANPPTVANPLILHGCDSSGNRLAPSNPGWVSAQPVDWDSGLPVIATSTNTNTLNLATVIARLVKFTASGSTTNPPMSQAAALDWCVVENSASNSNAYASGASVKLVSNCALSMSGSAYRAVVLWNGDPMSNCRIAGVTGSSGNRNGIEYLGNNNSIRLTNCTIYGHGGDGLGTSASSASNYYLVSNAVIANCGGTGIELPATASQTSIYRIEHCVITGCGGYGIDAQSAARLIATNNRLRDNTSGNFSGLGNYPTDLDNYTTDSDDATDYADSGTSDFRIKFTSPLWGKGYGAGDYPLRRGAAVGDFRGGLR